MFCELRVQGIARPDLGWILGKHPANSLRKEVKRGRVALGSWIDVADGSGYAVRVENDGVAFLDMMKKRNEASYVHAAPHSVTPYNLSVVQEALRSTLTGQFAEQAAQAHTAVHTTIVMGPWPIAIERVSVFAALLDLDVTPHSEQLLRTYAFRTRVPQPVAHALQKVFCIALLFTKRADVLRGGPPPYATFCSVSAGWIAGAPLRVQTALGYDAVSRTWRTAKERGNTAPREAAGKAQPNVAVDAEEQDAVVTAAESDSDDDHPEAHDVDEAPSVVVGASSVSGHEVSDSLVFGNCTLHVRRHRMMVQQVEAYLAARTGPEEVHVLDYGCGELALSRLLLATVDPTRVRVSAIDADADAMRRGLRGLRGRLTAVHGDVCAPAQLDKWARKVDVLLSCEVIEHMEAPERRALINVITKALRPRLLLLSTPNVAWNANIPHMLTQYRHPDHRIEYTRDQFEDEVLRPVQRSGYTVEELPLLPGDAVQPSFFLVARLDPACEPPADAAGFTNNLLTRIASRAEPLFLPLHRYTVTRHLMAGAFRSAGFMAHHGSVFCAAPTIAPVEHWRDAPDFLEHPLAALHYFRQAGVTSVTAERKYMGSRIQLLYSRPTGLRIQSRNGLAWYANPDDPMRVALEADLMRCLPAQYDFIMLDGELLPWALRAQDLIEKSFLVPGECCLASRLYAANMDPNDAGVVSAQRFLRSLANYSQRGDPIVRVFNVLAVGKMRKHGEMNATLMGDYVSAAERYQFINELCAKATLLRPVEAIRVALDDPASCAAVTQAWLEYCDSGGEGFVFKPDHRGTRVMGASGTMVVPAVKCRGREYLRLIYGIDYTRPEFLSRLTARSISGKRRLSHFQHEIADLLLAAFLAGEMQLVTRYSAAFYAVDYQQMDATL